MEGEGARGGVEGHVRARRPPPGEHFVSHVVHVCVSHMYTTQGHALLLRLQQKKKKYDQSGREKCMTGRGKVLDEMGRKSA